MRIASFRIENFKNIKLAFCDNPPDFLVLCGGNGAGKSALLQALMSAKEAGGSYGNFAFEQSAVSADAESALVCIKLEFSPEERAFAKAKTGSECPESGEVEVRISRGGGAQQTRNTLATGQILLSHYSSQELESRGFFDYIEAYRPLPKMQITQWDSAQMSDERMKQTLTAPSTGKFQYTKAYLASLVIRDLQKLQASQRLGAPVYSDSLQPIREFFDSFFVPMKFVDVRIDKSPFQFIIRTPRGEIDIDDLSSGEKEIFVTLVRFHQLQPKHSIILFDEADAHLHPDLERRYLNKLRDLSNGNQVWLTTHSPEMMIAAGTESLFTILKEPSPTTPNQFQRVTTSEELHSALSEVMGSRGMVSFNQRVIFIEGEDTSADREVYERLYPASAHNVSFVPAGDSATVRKTAERVNELLTMSSGFQQFYSIVDGDLKQTSVVRSVPEGRLFRLPVYHVENFLLDSTLILAVTKRMLGSKCPYSDVAAVTAELKAIVLCTGHVKPYAAAILDAKVAEAAKKAYDDVFQKTQSTASPIVTFAQAESEAEAVLKQAVNDGSWVAKCKGRDVLKIFCGKNGLRYEHLRNGIIAEMKTPPAALAEIMQQILG
jgi:predicted ATPase